MNLRSLKAELSTKQSTLDLANRTIDFVQKSRPVNQTLLDEALSVKRVVEKKISELKSSIEKLENNAKKKK